MTIHRATSFGHWNYFLALEEDLERLSRYVDLGGNDEAYSIEIARLLLSACAEVDVVLKLLVKKHEPASNASSINAYYPEISTKHPKFIDFEVQLPRYGIKHQPWVHWGKDTPPGWWSDHNKVKHHRDRDFQRATLKNCLNAMGGLFVAALHLYEEEAKTGGNLQMPRLFNVGDGYVAGASLGRFGNSFVCDLSK